MCTTVNNINFSTEQKLFKSCYSLLSVSMLTICTFCVAVGGRKGGEHKTNNNYLEQ
jgi:hypothetical protein